jgi:hypothetical protein
MPCPVRARRIHATKYQPTATELARKNVLIASTTSRLLGSIFMVEAMQGSPILLSTTLSTSSISSNVAKDMLTDHCRGVSTAF